MSSIFIRASLVYLLAGTLVGDLLFVEKVFHRLPFIWALLPAHMEFLLIGWLVQLAMAVAFWILPRFDSAPARGNERLAWISLSALNFGILVFSLSAVLDWPAWAMLSGRIAELLAAALFMVHAWPRVRVLGRHGKIGTEPVK